MLRTSETVAMEPAGIECLLFRCSGRLLACETSQAAKVLRPPRLVPLPRASGAVVGLFNYRGRVIGAIDLAPLLGLGQAADRGCPWLVVLKGKQFFAGLLVDDVLGIEFLPTDSLVSADAAQPVFLPKAFELHGAAAALLSVETLLANPAVIVSQ